MNKFKKILGSILICWVVVTIVFSGIIKYNRKVEAKRVDGLWFNNYSVVAHALGAIDSAPYTNSLEAFEYNYNSGTRVFEVDICETSDGKLVLNHGWQQHKELRLGQENATSEPMSYAEFMNNKIFGKYTPLSVDDLIELMVEYDDILIVLDYGSQFLYDEVNNVDEIFEVDKLIDISEKTINQIIEVDESLLDNIIPQIYYEEHFEKLDEIYEFDNYIYTLYKNHYNTNPKAVMDFCRKNDIDVITSNLYGEQQVITKELNRQVNLDRETKAGMAVFIHTINDFTEQFELLEDGYDGIYTDFLIESELRDGMRD